MIAVALLAALGIVAIAGDLYWRKSGSGQIDSIAVLPLDMHSTDPEADYISDGIAESINNSLAQLPSLKVIPYSVALHHKGKPVDIQKTGDVLQVETLLTGRVAQHGDNLSIGVELDDVRNGKQLWGQQYSGKVGDLLRVESDIAREVSQRIRSNHSTDQQKLALGSTENPAAYQLYLKGTYYTSKFTKDGFDKAIDYLHQAIAIDPNYWFDHYFLGRAYEQKGRFPEAIAALKHAISLGGTTEVWSSLGHAYAVSGKREEAQKAIEHLKQLSAQQYVAPYNIAVIYAGLGEKDEAFAWLNRAYQERSYLLTYLTVDERLDKLHSDPRFDELVRRVGLPTPTLQ